MDKQLLPIILLNHKIETRGKAFVLKFKKGNGRIYNVFVGASVSKIERNMFWVETWVLNHPRSQGLGYSIAANNECLDGMIIREDVPSMTTKVRKVL